ncbi:hypothetical protein ACH0C8_15770, partial [Acetobacter lovaniensis]|uniref:hypothetical protein n=1 Tax=Acetobacter lovaniensis TaxID=104100 RepID=UPI00376FAB06
MAKPRTDLTPTIRKEIADLYRSGTSPTELCQVYSLSNGILYRILQDHGVPARNPQLGRRKP